MRATDSVTTRAWLKAGCHAPMDAAERTCWDVGRHEHDRDELIVILSDSRRIADLQAERRALGDAPMTITTTAGGFLVNDEFLRTLESGMMWASSMMTYGTIARTDRGGDMHISMCNDTAVSGAITEINTVSSESVPALTELVLKAFPYRSGGITVAQELLEDSAVMFEQVFGRLLGERIGRALESAFTTGAGTTEPSGILTGATLGVTAASATGIDANELTDLYYSVDEDYRRNAIWLMHDNTTKNLRKLVDGQGRPLLVDPIEAGKPRLILGRPVVPNRYLASSVTAESKPILFGDVSRYYIRQQREIWVDIPFERFLTEGYVMVEARGRFDGGLADPGTHPVKYLQMSA